MLYTGLIPFFTPFEIDGYSFTLYNRQLLLTANTLLNSISSTFEFAIPQCLFSPKISRI